MEQLMFLIVVPDVHIRPEHDGSAVRQKQFVDDLKNRRLAGSVIADQRHALPTLNLKREIVKQRMCAERFP